MSESQPRMAAVAAPPGFGRIATVGMAWVSAGTVFGKAMAFVAQLVLGWLLSTDDYAVYALAVTISAFAGMLRDGGLPKILVQRGAQYASLGVAVFQLALLFNLACAGLIVLAAPLAAAFFDAPALPPLLWVIALATVISTPGRVFQAKLLIDLQFGRNTRITAASVLLSNAAVVAFALLGFGAMSFVLPGLFVAVFEAIAYGIAAGMPKRYQPLSWPILKDLFRASGWVMFGTLASTLVHQGDYLVIGKLQKELLGVYFFGTQLAFGVGVILASGIRSVLMPTLSRFSEDCARFRNAYIRAVGVSTFILTPLCIVGAIVAPVVIDFLWSGKWNDAIAVAVLITLSLVFRMLTPAALAALEALGHWRVSASLVLLDGVGVLVCAALGCWLGSLFALALCVSVNRAVMAVLQALVAGHRVNARIGAVAAALFKPILIATACGALAYVATQFGLLESDSLGYVVMNAALFLTLYGAAAAFWMRPQLEEASRAFRIVQVSLTTVRCRSI